MFSAPQAAVAATPSGPLSLVAHCSQSKSRDIVSNARQEKKWPVEFHSFDRDYIEKLTAGDTAVEQHFVSYFDGLLRVKLRFRLRSNQEVEDLRQEVYLRVLRTLRQGNGIQQPERFGAFVNSVCSNLLLEHFRRSSRTSQYDENAPELKDASVDLERDLISRESQQKVRALIGELSPKDHSILKAVLLDERDKDEVCRELGVDRGYLRVLLHRARNRFRVLLAGQDAASASA